MIKRQISLFLLAAMLLSLSVYGFSRTNQDGPYTEEIHKSFNVSSDSRISLESISGSVHVKGWDRNEVKIDAIKHAYREDRLGDAEVQISADSNEVRIKTKYRENNLSWNDGYNRENNPPTVEFTLMVPFNARIDKISVVNSSVDLGDLTGSVNVSSVNGRIRSSKLSGGISLSTVNGRLEGHFDQLSDSQHIRLSSVNGTVVLTLPDGVDAEVNANTVHGGISNDFGWEVTRGEYVGRYMTGHLGSGRSRITLGNVNGSISVKRGNGTPMVPPTPVLINWRDDRGSSSSDEILSDRDRQFLNKRRMALENGRETLDRKREALNKQRDSVDKQRTEIDPLRAEVSRRRDATIEERRVLDAERAVMEAERSALDSVRAMLDKQRSALDDDLTVIKAQLSEDARSRNAFTIDSRSNKSGRTKGR
jgi:hypothetical protein